MPDPTAKLLKVAVVPTFVITAEDGTLDELTLDPIMVRATDWPGFSVVMFGDDAAPKVLELYEQLRPETVRPAAAKPKRAPKG